MGLGPIRKVWLHSYTKERHNVTDGDELYVTMMQTRDAGPKPTLVTVGNTSQTVFFDTEEVSRFVSTLFVAISVGGFHLP